MAEIDRETDLKALARRLSEYAESPANSAQVRTDLRDAADLVHRFRCSNHITQPCRGCRTTCGRRAPD
jgi:hypothetical protein